MPAVVAPRITVRLVTVDQEVEALNWQDLAAKLKVPVAKKDATEAFHRIRALTYLGRQGWELVSYHKTDTSLGPAVWTFKRKVGK